MPGSVEPGGLPVLSLELVVMIPEGEKEHGVGRMTSRAKTTPLRAVFDTM
jgi:hypothetical protein